MGALEPQSPIVSNFAKKLYTEIKDREEFSISLSYLRNKSNIDLLRIYGRINIPLIGSTLNNKTIEKCYREVEERFKDVYKNYFENLSKGKKLDASKRTFLGSMSAYGTEAYFSTDTQAFRIINQYLSYQPYPLEQAKCLRLNEIKKIGEELTPYEYAKGLKHHYIAKIQWIYDLLGPSKHIGGALLDEALDRELSEMKCLPLPTQNESWKSHVTKWAESEAWGGQISNIFQLANEFFKTYHFSHFLEKNEKNVLFKTSPDFVIHVGQISENLSFKAYMQDTTFREFCRCVLSDFGSEEFFEYADLTEVKNFLLSKIQKEKRRSTFVYFFTDTLKNYQIIPKQNIGRFDYAPFKMTLEKQFRRIEYLTSSYQENGEYILYDKNQGFYDLLLACLLTIHVIRVCPEFSPQNRKVILMGICRMSSREKLDLYHFLHAQAPKSYDGKQQRNSYSRAEMFLRDTFSKVTQSRRNSSPISDPKPSVSPLRKINEFLRGYAFSMQQSAKVKIQLLFFQKGLMIQNLEAERAGYQAIDLLFCVKVIEDMKEFCGFPLPADVVFHILSWHYLSKNEIFALENFQKSLIHTKLQVRDAIHKPGAFFFLSYEVRHLIDVSISKVIPQSSYATHNEIKFMLYDCLRYAIYPHIASGDIYPFIYLAFEQKGPIFNQLQDWARNHCQVLRKLELTQSGMWVDTGWKTLFEEEYFQMSLTFFPSLAIPQSFNLEAVLYISRERLAHDPTLCQILRIFSMFLSHEFEPIKMYYLDLKKEQDSDKGKEIEPESEPEYINELCLFNNLLAYFDNPIFISLWESYQAKDKDEIGKFLYDFFFQIKNGIRKKMLALEGNAHDPSQYRHCKRLYKENMEEILKSMHGGKSSTWDKFFSIGEALIDVEYRFSISLNCDYKQIEKLEEQCIDQERGTEKDGEEEINLQNVFYNLESRRVEEKFIETDFHEVTFRCCDRNANFRVVYPGLPSIDLLYWQILMLMKILDN
ncbi:putative uncharacterized protein [Parachlamydia acanthamoebae UV-7]|uniref:Uncharacterized protein n=3 Tax=Parachlamydia acanthamoebae TaxID=83552 RepID=F8KYC0_PARAV|nr:hypothetical protein [Parachlamydia acanthamoebae]KIA78407.1 hypothetical protein DB43_EA00040 [Parachlamydia acanthamoebae]CCB85855.1 putative uncharacterized protein [Parachlamydia acanthamoebae UV-7]